MSALPASTPETAPFQPLTYGEWEATPEAARIEDPLQKVQKYDNRLRKDLFKAGLYDAEAEDEIFNAGADQALRAGHITDKSQYAPTAKPKDPNFLARQLVRKGDTEKASAIFRYQSFLSRPDTDPVTLERARQEAELDPDTENELTRAAVRSGEIPFAVVPDKDGNAIFEIDPELGALDRQQILDLAGDEIDPRFLPDLEKQLTRAPGTNYTPAQFRQSAVFDNFLKEQKRTDEFLHGELEKAQDEYNKTGQLSTETQESLDRTLAALDVDGEFAPTTRGRLIRDTIKRASKPEGYDPENPQQHVQYLEDGTVWLPEQVIFDQAKHDQVLDSLSVTPEQKEAAKKLRAGRLESIAPAMVDALGADPDALDFWEKSKASGKTDSEIATEYYSKPENYNWFANRANSFGMSLWEAGPGLYHSVAALAGSESSRDALLANSQDMARNKEFARLFGDSYGVGQSLLNTSSQVAADVLVGIAVSAVATPVAGAAVAGSRAAASSLVRGLARTAISEGARSTAAGFLRSGAGSAARTLATMGDDVAAGLARSIGGQTGVAASSFTRSAGSAYVQAYSALDAQTNPAGQPLYSDEEKRKLALGTAITQGTATTAITLGFGRMLGQGAEGLITGGLSTGVLRRVVGMTDDQIISGVRQSALAVLRAAAVEAPEEATDQLVGHVIQKVATGEDFRLGPALKEALEAGLVGGLLGGGIGAVQVGINKYRSPKVVALENANAPASAAALEAATKAQAEAPPDPAANLKEASQDLDLRVTELKAQVQELSGDPKKNAGKLARAKKRLAEATAEKTRIDYAIKNPGAMQMGMAPEGIAAAEARGVATPAAGAPQAAAPQTVAEGAPAQPAAPTPAAPVVLNRRASALSKVLTNKGVSDGPATRFAAAFARNLSPDTTLEDARGQILEAFRSAGGIFADETADTAAIRANPQTWVDAGYTPEESQKFAELAAAEIEAAQEAADAANEAIVIPEPAAAEASTPEDAQTDATPAAAATPGVTITEPTQSFADSPFFGGEINTPDGTKGHYSVKILDDGTAVLSDIQIGYEGDAGRGKGFGTQAYEAIGRKLAQRGITLQSTRWDKHQTAVSPQALRVWEKLEAAGLARKTGESETKVYDRQAGRETIAVAPEYEFVVPETVSSPEAVPEDIIGTDQAPEPPDVEVVPEPGDQELDYGDGSELTVQDNPLGGPATAPAPKPQTTKATKFSQKARALVERMLTPESRTQPPEYLQQQKAFTPTQTQIQSRIAALYEAMPVDDSANPEVVQAYQNLVTEVVAQYRAMLGTGIKIEMGSENPYATSGDMIDDVERGRLWIYKTEPSSYGSDAMLNAGNHPMLAPTEFTDLNGEPMLANDVFRAVHDYVAHAAFGFSFGPLGEEAAWKAHLSTLRDPLARLALTTETRGQNSWVNYRPEMLRDGMPIKKGEPGYVAPQDRPFATQKFALLPEESMTLVPIVAPKRGKAPKTKKPTEKQLAVEMRAGTPLAVHETLFNDTISQGWVPTRNVLLKQLAEAGFGGQVYGTAFVEAAVARIRALYPLVEVPKTAETKTLKSLGLGDIKGAGNKLVSIPVFADGTTAPFTNDPVVTSWQKAAGLSVKIPEGVKVNPAIDPNPKTGFVDSAIDAKGVKIFGKGDSKRAGNVVGDYVAAQNKEPYGRSLETLPPVDTSVLAGRVDFAGFEIIPGETTEDDILRYFLVPTNDGRPSLIEQAVESRSPKNFSGTQKQAVRDAAELAFLRELREFTLDVNSAGSVNAEGFGHKDTESYKAYLEGRAAKVWSRAGKAKDGTTDTSAHWNSRGRPTHLSLFVDTAIKAQVAAAKIRPSDVRLGSDDVDQATALERAAARNDADNAGDMLVALDEAFTPEVLRGSAAIMGMPPETGIVDVASGVQILVSRIDSVPALRKAFEQAYLATLDLPPGPSAKRAVAIQKAKAMASDELVVLASRSALVQPGVVQAVRDAGFFKSLSYGLNTFTDTEIAQHRADNRAAITDLQLDGDLRSAIERIARSAKYPRRYRAVMLAALKMQVLPNISIVDAPAEAYAGSYTHSARLITLNLASSNGRGMLDVLAHELLHAATLEAIANPQTKAAKELLARLERARQKAAEVIPSDMSYAVSSIDEFITHAATDPRLQVILRETFEKGKTTWQRVVDAVAKFFGIANPDFVSDLWGFINHAAEYGLRPGVAASREMRSETGVDWSRRDAEYLAAVEAGDMAKAQAMVDEAARAAGYQVNRERLNSNRVPRADERGFWHWSTADSFFNTFDSGRSPEGFHFGSFDAASDRASAVRENIEERDGTYFNVFLSGRPVRILDSGDNNPSNIALALEQQGIITTEQEIRIRVAHNKERYAAQADNTLAAELAKEEQGLRDRGRLAGGPLRSASEELTAALPGALFVYENKYEHKGEDSFIVFSPNQIKSADPVTRDDAGNVIPLSARFRPSSPDIRYTIGSVHDALKTRETGAALPRGVKTLPGMSDNPESNTVEKQFENLDEIFATIPNPIASSGSWITFMRAIGKQLGKKTPVPIAPDRAVGYSAGQGFDHIMVDLKQHPEYVEARTQGLATGTRMLEDFRSGKLGRQDLASLFLWGLFSRGIGAYPQEGAFSAIHRAGLLDKLEMVFTNQMTPVELRDWALETAKGSPVGGAHRNVKAIDAMLNALTYQFDGRPAIDVLLDAWKSDMTGPQLRREVYRMFTKDRPSLQIQNKVLSFIILVSGRPDVLVLDRVQFRHLWGGEKLESIISRFQEKLVKAKEATLRRRDVKSSAELRKAVADVVPERTDNVYDRLPVIVTPEAEAKAIKARAEIKAFGSFWATVLEFVNPKPAGTFGFAKVSGKNKVARSGLVGLGNGLHGLAAYEAIERGLSAATEQAYRDAGIEYPGIGAFHWDSWLVSSRQAISHPTLELIAGSRDPNTSVMEGKFNTINYGMLYRYDGMYMRELLTNPGHYVMLTPEAAKDAYTTAAVNKALGRKGKNQLKLKKSEELEDDEDGPQERTRPWTEDLSPAERSDFDKWLRTLGPTVEPDPDAIADGDPDERGDVGFEDRPDEAVRAALTPEGAAPDGSRGSVDQFLPTLPAGVSYSFDDTHPKYLAFARRSQPGVVTINKQALAAVIAGLSPANARAIVSKIVKHEIAHLAAFSTFTDADIAEMARGMSAHEINEVARRYYDSPDALARLDADLESGAITNEAIVEEYLRMQLELATDGATTEATIAFHSNNPGFVARMVKYLKDALVALWRNVAGPQEDFVNRVAISRLAREYRAILRGHAPQRPEPFDPADPNRDTRAALAPQQPTDPDGDAAIREIFTESVEDFTKPYEPGSLWRRLFVTRTGDRRFPTISDKRQSSLVANERLVFGRRKQLNKAIAEEKPDAQVLAAAAGDTSPTTTPEQDTYIAEEFAAAMAEARKIKDPAAQATAIAEAYELKQRLTTAAYVETARIKKRRIDEAFAELERTAPKTASNLKAMREGIDNISRILKEYQPDASPLRMVFDTQEGIYLTRVYKIHHKDGNPLDIFGDPAMADVRERAQDQLMESIIQYRTAEIIEQEAEAGKIIGETEARDIALAEAAEQDLGRILLEDYLLSHGSKALPHNGSDFRTDLTRFFKKMPVPEALRDVLEEVTDPVELLTRTGLNVGMLAASTVFTRDLARAGFTSGAMVTGQQWASYRKLIQEPDNDKYLAMLVDNGWAKRKPAAGYVEVAPDVHVPAWLVKAKEDRDLTYVENFRKVSTTTKKADAGKLADLYAHPDVAAWMDHQFTKQKAVSTDDAKLVQKIGEVFAKATGTSLGIATLGSVGFYSRNLVGTVFFLAANGINPFSAKSMRASKLAVEAFLNQESGEVTKLTGIGVLNDDLRPETIKELLKGETDRPGGLNILELIGKVLGGKKGVEYGAKTTAGLAKLAELATAIDGIAKATAFYAELETMREAYPDKSAKWHEDEAAKVVKLTHQAKSQTPPFIDSLTSSSYGRLFAPFLRFKGEMFRLTGNIIAQSAAEIRSDNPAIRARGYKRAAGFAMIAAFSVAGPALISAMYGVGDDEEYALREALPPYLRGNSIIYRPSDDGKSIQSYDFTYLNPFSFVGDPISRVGRAVMRGEPGDGMDELAIWINSNFLSEQILAGAAGEVLRNEDSDGRPITFETDSADEKLIKFSKHLAGSSFTPQSLKAIQRSYDTARRGTPEDTPFFETASGIVVGHALPFRPRAFETEALALRAARTQAETNRQVRALASPLKRRVNYTEGDIQDIVADLQDSTASLNQDIARMISGYRGLGLDDAAIAKQLVEAGRSREFARAIVFKGIAAGPSITPATRRDMYEAGEKAGGAGGGEKRVRAVAEAMRQYPKIQQVRGVPGD